MFADQQRRAPSPPQPHISAPNPVQKRTFCSKNQFLRRFVTLYYISLSKSLQPFSTFSGPFRPASPLSKSPSCPPRVLSHKRVFSTHLFLAGIYFKPRLYHRPEKGLIFRASSYKINRIPPADACRPGTIQRRTLQCIRRGCGRHQRQAGPVYRRRTPS